MFDEAWAQAAREVYMGNFKISETEAKCNEAQERKKRPICTGVLDYFPDALLAVAYCSYVSNEQHNPGKPLHWSKNKSIGKGDEILRHLIDRGKIDTDGVRHSAKLAWRSLELLQREIEAERETVTCV